MSDGLEQLIEVDGYQASTGNHIGGHPVQAISFNWRGELVISTGGSPASYRTHSVVVTVPRQAIRLMQARLDAQEAAEAAAEAATKYARGVELVQAACDAVRRLEALGGAAGESYALQREARRLREAIEATGTHCMTSEEKDALQQAQWEATLREMQQPPPCPAEEEP